MNDKFTVRAVVVFLGMVALTGVVLMGMLALNDKSVPDAIIGVTGTALGALGGLLARTSIEEPITKKGLDDIAALGRPGGLK